MLKHMAQWDRSDANYSSFISLHALFFISSTDIKTGREAEYRGLFLMWVYLFFSLRCCSLPTSSLHLAISSFFSLQQAWEVLLVKRDLHLCFPASIVSCKISWPAGGGLAREDSLWEGWAASHNHRWTAGSSWAQHPLFRGEGEIILNVAVVFDRTAGHCGYLYACFSVGVTRSPSPPPPPISTVD